MLFRIIVVLSLMLFGGAKPFSVMFLSKERWLAQKIDAGN